ncbi:MAG: hypothetical protein AAF990_17725 [Bacteroidota bacterium]
MKDFLFFALLMILSVAPTSAQFVGEFTLQFDINGYPLKRYPRLQMEEAAIGVDTLYKFDGKYATKEFEYYKLFEPIFTLKRLNVLDESLRVTIRQEDDKLVIENERLDNILRDSQKVGPAKRLTMAIGNGVRLSKKGAKLGMITVPLKIYMGNNSDELPDFTNNVVSDINLGITVGHNTERYLFRPGRAPELRNHHFIFVFLTANRLQLNALNTDNDPDINDDDILALSLGLGYQFGFRRFGISLMFGQDLPSSSLGDKWVFRNQPWFGLGIGYQLF